MNSAATTITLRDLRGHTLASRDGKPLGTIRDLVARLQTGDYPLLVGLTLRVAGRDVFVHTSDIDDLAAATGPRLTIPKVDLDPFTRRPGEVRLHHDVLGHRVADTRTGRLYKAHDIRLTRDSKGWVVTGIDLHHHRWWAAGTPTHTTHGWATFETLIGHAASTDIRTRNGALHRMRPADLADLLQEADTAEQRDILATLHTNPDLEADVFEELDQNRGTILARRSDTDIANLLTRMQPDDAIDTLTDLPQPRRRPVLAQLPPEHAAALRQLGGYHADSAGGLMTLHPHTADPDHTAVQVIAALRQSPLTPEALTHTIYTLDAQDHLHGAIPLITLLRADPDTPCRALADPAPLSLPPDADLPQIAATMADHNLTTLPITTHTHQLLGVVTIDDLLTRLIPQHWRTT